MKVNEELNLLQDRIDDCHSQAFKLVDDHMRSVACKWHLKNPNHTIAFMDAMGVAGWLIDGEWVVIPEYPRGRGIWIPGQESQIRPEGFQSYEEVYTGGERALHRIYAPLFEAMEWYADEADRFHIAIEFKYERLEV